MEQCRCQAPLRGGACTRCGQLPERCPCPVQIDQDLENADWLKPSRDIAQGRFREARAEVIDARKGPAIG